MSENRKSRAQIVMERYWEEVNNQGQVELIRELCADPRENPSDLTLRPRERGTHRLPEEKEDYRATTASCRGSPNSPNGIIHINLEQELTKMGIENSRLLELATTGLSEDDQQ